MENAEIFNTIDNIITANKKMYRDIDTMCDYILEKYTLHRVETKGVYKEYFDDSLNCKDSVFEATHVEDEYGNYLGKPIGDGLLVIGEDVTYEDGTTLYTELYSDDKETEDLILLDRYLYNLFEYLPDSGDVYWKLGNVSEALDDELEYRYYTHEDGFFKYKTRCGTKDIPVHK